MSSVSRWPDGPPYARTLQGPRASDRGHRLRLGALLLLGAGVALVVAWSSVAVPAAVAGAVTATAPTWDCDVTGIGGPSEEPDPIEDPVGLPTAARIGPGQGCTFVMDVTNTSPLPVTLRAVEDVYGGPGRADVKPSFDWAGVDGGPQVAARPGRLGASPDPLTLPGDVLEAHAAVDTRIAPGETVVLRVRQTGGTRPVDDCMRIGWPIDVVVSVGPVSGRAGLSAADGEPVMPPIGPTTEQGCG